MSDNSTRENLLAEASRLIHSVPFTKEMTAKVDALFKLADELNPVHNELRKLRLAQAEEKLAEYSPEYARRYRSDLETRPSGGYLVPKGMAEVLIQKLAWFDPLFDPRYVNFIMSDTGAALDIPVGETGQWKTFSRRSLLGVWRVLSVLICTVCLQPAQLKAWCKQPDTQLIS